MSYHWYTLCATLNDEDLHTSRRSRSLSDGRDLADDLIATTYAALLGEVSWQDFLDKLNAASPGALSTMFFHDFRRNSGAVAYVSGTDGREKALDEYEQYYSNLNPWMRKVNVTPLGRAIIGEEIIPREAFNRSEYYNDYIHKNGLETGIGLTLYRDSSCYFLLSTLTDDKDIDRNLERAEVLTRIAPHLKRVFRYYRSGDFHSTALDLGEGIGDASGMAVILVNDDLRLVRTSKAARKVLASGDPIGLDAMGRVRFNNPDLQSSLRMLLDHRQIQRGTEIINDPSSSVQLMQVGANPSLEFFAGPIVAILIGAKHGAITQNLRELTTSYGLSPAEARVFTGVVAGRDLAEIARAAGVKRETIRSQLKSIFLKTGAASQKDIVRLVAGISKDD